MKSLLVVAVFVLCSSVTLAQGLGFNAVGGGIGYASVSFNGGTSTESIGGFVIAAHADLGELAKDIVLFPDIEYFSGSKDIGGGTWKVSDFAINANVHYNIQMEGQVAPYVGAGLGYNAFSTTAEATIPFFGTISVTGSASRIGINLLAGANYKMNDKMMLFIEPRYVLASDFNHFLIKVGATFAMN